MHAKTAKIIFFLILFFSVIPRTIIIHAQNASDCADGQTRDPASGDYCYGGGGPNGQNLYYVHYCGQTASTPGTCPTGYYCQGGTPFSGVAGNCTQLAPTQPQSFTIVTSPNPPPVATVGKSYTPAIAIFALEPNGQEVATAPTISIINGAPPPGMGSNIGIGVINGTPTQSGTFPFTVQVCVSGTSNCKTQNMSITVNQASTGTTNNSNNTVYIELIDAATNKQLTGAAFSAQSASGSGQIYTSTATLEFTNVGYIIQNVPNGSYNLCVTQSPPGYTSNSQNCAVVTLPAQNPKSIFEFKMVGSGQISPGVSPFVSPPLVSPIISPIISGTQNQCPTGTFTCQSQKCISSNFGSCSNLCSNQSDGSYCIDANVTPTPTPPQITTTVELVPNISPTLTPPPSSVQATPTPVVGSTSFQLNFKLSGIGNNTGDNTNPQHPTRNAYMVLEDQNKNVVAQATGSVTFNGSTYNGIISFLPGLVSGNYFIKVKADGTLYSLISPNQITVTAAQQNPLSSQTILVSGDVTADNRIDLTDYNIILGCFGAQTCSQKTTSDFNDDGHVDEKDVNIFLRGLNTKMIGD